jgi:hypothetical protein
MKGSFVRESEAICGGPSSRMQQDFRGAPANPGGRRLRVDGGSEVIEAYRPFMVAAETLGVAEGAREDSSPGDKSEAARRTFIGQ